MSLCRYYKIIFVLVLFELNHHFCQQDVKSTTVDNLESGEVSQRALMELIGNASMLQDLLRLAPEGNTSSITLNVLAERLMYLVRRAIKSEGYDESPLDNIELIYTNITNGTIKELSTITLKENEDVIFTIDEERPSLYTAFTIPNAVIRYDVLIKMSFLEIRGTLTVTTDLHFATTTIYDRPGQIFLTTSLTVDPINYKSVRVTGDLADVEEIIKTLLIAFEPQVRDAIKMSIRTYLYLIRRFLNDIDL